MRIGPRICAATPVQAKKDQDGHKGKDDDAAVVELPELRLPGPGRMQMVQRRGEITDGQQDKRDRVEDDVDHVHPPPTQGAVLDQVAGND